MVSETQMHRVRSFSLTERFVFVRRPLWRWRLPKIIITIQQHSSIEIVSTFKSISVSLNHCLLFGIIHTYSHLFVISTSRSEVTTI